MTAPMIAPCVSATQVASLPVCQMPEPTMLKTGTDEKIYTIAIIVRRAHQVVQWARWCKRIQ
jgi:hypothetical protein